jgi:cytochrome b subunit of formate dehydrogenase
MMHERNWVHATHIFLFKAALECAWTLHMWQDAVWFHGPQAVILAYFFHDIPQQFKENAQVP